MEESIEHIQEEITNLMETGKLKLPGLNQIAIRVREVISKDDFNTAHLAKIVQADIPLTARLIQVANSPLYKSGASVEHIQAAISRLGVNVTKNLVTSFAIRRMFTGKDNPVKRVAEASWKHSVQVATIAYTLGRVTPKIDPEHCMLSGLIHDIGVLPVLAYLQLKPEIASDADKLSELIDACRVPLGKKVVSVWRFEKDMLPIIEHSEDWFYEGSKDPSDVDVVMLAQLMVFTLTKARKDLPLVEQVPAYEKFPVFRLGKAAHMELISQAKEEMADLTSLLNSY